MIYHFCENFTKFIGILRKSVILYSQNFAKFKIILSKFRVSQNFKNAVSQPPYTVCRVDSFVFFLDSRNTKLHETGHCFAEFQSFRETEKKYKTTKKSVSNCFAKLRNQVSFRIYVYFLFKFCTFYSSLIPFIQVVYLFRVSSHTMGLRKLRFWFRAPLFLAF